jgi:hypothetical protein
VDRRWWGRSRKKRIKGSRKRKRDRRRGTLRLRRQCIKKEEDTKEEEMNEE